MNEHTLFNNVMGIPNYHVQWELVGKHNDMEVGVPSDTSEVESTQD